jgi:hypothetical protein
MRAIVDRLLMVVVTVGCSTLSTRVDRDRLVERLRAASVDAPEADRALVNAIRLLLPGEEVPKLLLSPAGPDLAWPALDRWRGQVGDWRVEALQTTNDSQIGCVPWGTITAVSFSARRAHAQDTYAGWHRRLTAMMTHPPTEARPLAARWTIGAGSPWYVNLAFAEPDRVTLDLSCEDGFVARSAAEQRDEADEARDG